MLEYLGWQEDGEIVGVDDSNRLRSKIQDVANGCDPRIDVHIVSRGNVVEIIVPEGTDKPYRCKDGFFLRIGPNSQQLTRDERNLGRSCRTCITSYWLLNAGYLNRSSSIAKTEAIVLPPSVLRKTWRLGATHY